MKKICLIKNATMLGLAALFSINVAQADSRHYGVANFVSLEQAIQTAKAGTEAYPMKIDLEHGIGGAVYEIEMLSNNGQALMAVVNAQTGELMSMPGMAIYQDYEDQMENTYWLNGIKSGQIQSLESAINQVKAQYGGKVLEVDTEFGFGGAAYEVKIVAANGVRMEVYINASPNGQALLPTAKPAMPTAPSAPAPAKIQ